MAPGVDTHSCFILRGDPGNEGSAAFAAGGGATNQAHATPPRRLRVSVAVTDTMTNSVFGEERLTACSHYLGKSGQGLKAGTWRQELMQRLWRGAAP